MLLRRILPTLGAIALVVACAAATLRNEDRARALDFYIRGTVAEQTEDYYKAIFLYREALRFDSGSAYMHVALSQAYLAVGSLAQADEELDLALASDPHHVPALELKSILLHSTGRLKEALSTYERILDHEPDNENALQQLLDVSLKLGDYERAEQLYVRIESTNLATDAMIRSLAGRLLEAGQFERAIPLLDRMVEIDSLDAGIIYSRGTAYLQLGDTASAITDMHTALRLRPTESQFWMGVAILAFNRRDFEGAIALVDTALSKSEATGSLYHLRGTAQQRLGRNIEAIPDLERAVSLDSLLFTSHGALALIYDGLDSLELAAHHYEEAIRLSDSAAVYLNNLAYTFAVRKIRLEEARTLSELSLAKDPKNGSYMDTMGWIEFGSGNFRAALEWLRRAVKLSPQAAEVYEHLGDTYRELGQGGKAESAYRKALQLDPQNEKVRVKLES